MCLKEIKVKPTKARKSHGYSYKLRIQSITDKTIIKSNFSYVVFDTGAEFTMLNILVASKLLHKSIDDLRNELIEDIDGCIKITGIGQGTLMGKLYRLPYVRLGKRCIEDFHFYVVDSFDKCLLGMDFIMRCSCSINNGVLRITDISKKAIVDMYPTKAKTYLSETENIEEEEEDTGIKVDDFSDILV